MTPDLYAVLGVSNEAPAADIKTAYRRLAKELHPDHGGDAAKFDAVARAYKVLSDPARRERYDSSGDMGDDPNGKETQALAVLGRMMSQIMEQAVVADSWPGDIVGAIRDAVAEKIGEAERLIVKQRRECVKLEKFADRFTVKGDGVNTLREMVLSRRDGLVKSIAGNEGMIEVFKAVSLLIADAGFRADEATTRRGYVDPSMFYAVTPAA